MASKPLCNLFIFLSILTSTIANHHPHPNHSKPTSNFIWSSCLSTSYPPLCYHSLKGYGSKIGQSERQLALTALALSLSKARSAARFVSRAKKLKGINQNELEAVKDCIDTMSDGVDNLHRSFRELAHIGHTNGEDFMWRVSNVQSWVSAALTDESTCVDGLSDDDEVYGKSGKVKGAIQVKVNSVAQVTSNALALVNRFVGKNTNNVKKP